RLSLNRFFLRILRLMGKYSDPFIHPNQRLFNDLVGNLVNLFYFGDRTSMAYSIETRFPFMDHRLVEFWFKLPIVYKMHDGWTKYIARKAFNGRLPDTITWRKDKMGWEMPQAHWFKGELKEWVINRIQSSPFLPQLGVRMDVRKKLESETTTPKTLKQIVKLLNLAIWYDTFIDVNGKPADVEARACLARCSNQSS
ncbi:MAG: asparagine synthase-related protein, partial [bacterium]